MDARIKCRKCGVIDDCYAWERSWYSTNVNAFMCSMKCKGIVGILAGDLLCVYSTRDALALVNEDDKEIDFFVVSDEDGVVWRMLHTDDQQRITAYQMTEEDTLRLIENIKKGV